MKKLYIYGCSGFGIEVEMWLKDSRLLIENDICKNFNFCGFLGDKKYIEKDFLHLYKGGIELLDHNSMLIFAIGKNVEFKKSLYLQLTDKNVIFPTLLHNGAFVASNMIGKGNIIAVFAGISTQIYIGNFNIINSYATIGHNAIIKDFNAFSSFSNIMGNTSIGNENILGVGSCLLPKAQIGDRNIIAPGSYVYKRFRDDNLISGNPATAVSKNQQKGKL